MRNGLATDRAVEKTVLVVDDDPYMRLLLEMTIAGGSYQVLSASDGEEAIALARAHHPNMMLLDVSMPRLDGFEVCRQLKADPATREIAIVMVTARTQDEDRERGLAAGADAYVTKPFSPLSLLQRLASHART